MGEERGRVGEERDSVGEERGSVGEEKSSGKVEIEEDTIENVRNITYRSTIGIRKLSSDQEIPNSFKMVNNGIN